MKSAFLSSKVLLCLYDKQNNTWLLVNMGFLFSCSTRHLTSWLRSLVSYRVKHSKRNSTHAHVIYRDLAKPKSGARIFFPHVSRAQCLAPARTRTQVVRLGAQCTNHWTTGQSCSVGVPAVQLSTRV